MSELLSRIKARLETGQSSPQPVVETGWVRSALVQMEQEERDGSPLASGLGTQLDTRPPPTSPAASEASEALWSNHVLELPIPDGFYCVTPAEDLRDLFPNFPTLAALRALKEGVLSSPVILVDRNLDRTLRRLVKYSLLMAKGLEADTAMQIRKIAELVADFYGGARDETSASKGLGSDNHSLVVLLGQIRIGACRPRAVLFKFLCDACRIRSRLVLGIQGDLARSGSAAASRPLDHLTNVVTIDGMEVLVDLLRRPGQLRLFSQRGVVLYHTATVADSDSADYDSGDSPHARDSPRGPHSPLGSHDRMGADSPEADNESPRSRLRRRAVTLPNTHGQAMLEGNQRTLQGTGASGESDPGLRRASSCRKNSTPSTSESGLDPVMQRRRHRRRTNDDAVERNVVSSPEHPILRRFQKEELAAVPSRSAGSYVSMSSSPDLGSEHMRRFQRVRSEAGSIPSSPEHSHRIYPSSTLGGSRGSLHDEADSCGTLSPDHMHPLPPPRRWRRRSHDRSTGDPNSRDSMESPEASPIREVVREGAAAGRSEQGEGHARGPREIDTGAAARLAAIEAMRRDSGTADSSPSSDVARRLHKTRSSSGADNVPPRPGHSGSGDRRSLRRSVPEVSDEVVKAVRAINERLRSERRRSDGTVIKPAGEKEEGKAHMKRLVSLQFCPKCRRTSGAETVQDFAAGLEQLNIESNNSSGKGYDESTMSPDQGQPQVFEVGTSEGERAQAPNAPLLETVAAGGAGGPSSGGALSPTEAEAADLSELLPYPEWHIDFSELRIGMRVGVGSFGEVFRGIWRGTEVAIKALLEQDLTAENTEDFCNEISLLSRLRHPNVILFLGACVRPPHLSMVTEYMHMGSLFRLVHTTEQGQKLSWRRRLKMLRDICRGMMCVQRMNIVHRDLKSANCLVDKHWTVKVCDFGLSKLASDAMFPGKTAVGTPEWMAPELLRNEPVTWKCDVFSFGVICWELTTLRRPWEGYKPMQVVLAVAHQGAKLETPPGLLGKLIEDCFLENPAERPSFEEILTRLHECDFLAE